MEITTPDEDVMYVCAADFGNDENSRWGYNVFTPVKGTDNDWFNISIAEKQQQ